MKKKREKKEWIDDGRVIADMSVEGMRSGLGLGKPAPGKGIPGKKRQDAFGETPPKPEPLLLSPTEKKSVTRGVLRGYLAALLAIVALLALVFLVAQLWLN